jgi:hypothetical protein
MKKNIIQRFVLFPLIFILVAYSLNGQSTEIKTISTDDFEMEFNRKGISSFWSKSDEHRASIVGKRGEWGDVDVKYQVADGDWLNIYKGATSREILSPEKVKYTDYKEGVVLKMERTFERVRNGIDWTIRLESMFDYPMTIGDFSIPISWPRPSGEEPNYIFEETFIKHQYIGGNSSFIYFSKPSGEPPFLVLMTKPGTKLEYFDSAAGYSAHIHSQWAAAQKEGSWRMENTALELAPKGKPGSSITYGFRMQWVNSYDELRDVLYQNNLFDIRVVPGMTLPQGLSAKFSLRTKNKIDSISAEFPKQTKIDFVKEKEKDLYIYKVLFERLGENKLTIHYNGNQKSILEFFSTEPVETLIKKRSDFLTQSQQHTNPSKWYNGLYSIWDMSKAVLRGPDNTDGFDHWWGYVLASDDIGLVKAPYIASKNVYFPEDDEIASVEYHIENFVWGGLQRTDKETNPYGIHGVPNWREARDPLLRARSRDYNLDKMKIWRSYDYPHITKMYYHMFQIAEFYPDKVQYLDAKGYLERAFQTAKAYFTYPYEILPWYDTYKWGCYNEIIIIPLIKDLERYGRKSDADWLRQEWEKKVKYFVYDDKYPFRSEYSIDRTAFESSYAFAKYGTLNKMKPDEKLWYDVNLEKWYSHPNVKQEDSRDFMHRQNTAGLAVRGWVNPTYYSLGSDDSEGGGLSYMARMGGWSILDYGLHFAEKPYDWIQLGYASYLSSYALMNTGTKESNYGYWFPGKENDGALGWAFNSQKHGRIWLQGREIERGPWNYDGEADLGMGAIGHTASTVLVNDPIFEWFAYGGNLDETTNGFAIVPKDGLRTRFAIVANDTRFQMELERDGFAKNNPILVSKSMNEVSFVLENRVEKRHRTKLNLENYGNISVKCRVDGKLLKVIKEGNIESFEIPVSGKTHQVTLTLN